MRSLSNRIAKIQREMNPILSANGAQLLTASTSLANSRATYIDRSFVVLANGLAAGSTLTDNDFTAIPQGSKILGFRVRNLTSRTLRVVVGPNSKIVADSGTQLNQLDRFIAAPYSRFPTIKVNIPDLLANGDFFNITSGANNEFCQIYATADGDKIEIKVHVRCPVV
jgi:hypothetical protein